ncbi:DUF4244 domain-containing protein [Galactobacter valiniphilus]|uniref:DUF4244 domain-containing protein n=1 Tax=Galactobacter valiniphilus TaxID=2676122 RepID=A0A399JHX8_9MICC|nr:DUF4244 domain-containing protein [Galactobacter valiniphilus]RII43782.1 DUF4244 domain-containing protein [Galactobacter valiniphilus]
MNKENATGCEAPVVPEPARRLRGEAGIATAEFSIVTLAAVGFAGLLVTILGSGEVRGMLMNLIRQAIGG